MQDEEWAGGCQGWGWGWGAGGTLPEPACCSTDLLGVRGVEPHWPGARGLWKPKVDRPPFHAIYDPHASSHFPAQVPTTGQPMSSGSH